MNIEDIHKRLPCYALPQNVIEYWEEDRILYGELSTGEILKIDNKNLQGSSIGIRRMGINSKNLLELKRAVLSIGQLIKSKNKLFVDKDGKVFRYKKSKRVKLTTHKITKYKKVEGKGFLIWVYGITFPIEVAVFNYNEYVQLLHIAGGYMLYDYSEHIQEETWRMI